MNNDQKRDILALSKEITSRLIYEDYQTIDCLLSELRMQLITSAPIAFSQEECKLLINTYNLLVLQRAYYPSLLKIITAGCSCNEEIALLENSDAIKMQKQQLQDTLRSIETMSATELSGFIEVKQSALVPGEADLEIVIFAEQQLRQIQ